MLIVSREVSLVELQIADQVAQVSLGQLGDGGEEVGDVVHQALGIRCLVVDDGIHRDDHVVGGDHLLGWHVDHLFAHVDQLHRLDERQDQVEAWVLGRLEPSQPLDQATLVRADDLDRADQEGDAHHGDDGDDDGDDTVAHV